MYILWLNLIYLKLKKKRKLKDLISLAILCKHGRPHDFLRKGLRDKIFSLMF